ncbi:MAG: RluA family pseudouridine synthase [Proteobacteria bacterium]|nr:RluA family pseudouridine synthase [Pseudomonadota bacterium]
MRRWVVGPECDGQRLDCFLRQQLPTLGRHALRRLLREDPRALRVDGRRPAPGLRLRAGQAVELRELAALAAPVPQPELTLSVVATTARWIVIDKPPGMPSHPLRPGETGTVANALVARFPECALVGAQGREAGLVHRLDGGTSGVLVAARDAATYEALRARFTRRAVTKRYLALVGGALGQATNVTLAIEALPGDRRRVRATAIAAGPGRPARTAVQPLARLGQWTLVRATTCSGARHQIRAHLAAIGHPLAGDELYGGGRLLGLGGPLLHAESVAWDDYLYRALLPPAWRELLLELPGARDAALPP